MKAMQFVSLSDGSKMALLVTLILSSFHVFHQKSFAEAAETLTSDVAEAADTFQAGVYWNEEKAKAIAFRHLERQIKPHFFETQHKAYFESVKSCENNPDLKFAKCQTTDFPDGAYSQAFEGENLAYYYHENGVLFKVSVCDKPFGKNYDYPRRCVEYGLPGGNLQTISLDVSPDESYIYDLRGELVQHWKDGQGFSPTDTNTWERSRPDERYEKP